MSARPSSGAENPSGAQAPRCPICGGGSSRTFLELRDMPAQDGVVYATRDAAQSAATGDIRLAYCPRCGYIGNVAFSADHVGFVEYNYAQHHSPRYRQHVIDVVTNLVDTHALRNKTIVDIGCGDGFFLRRMCDAGNNRGIGIDPSLPDEARIDADRLTLIKDFYSEKYSRYRGELVSCRHVIDELPDPRGFVELISGALSADSDAMLYLELPDALRTFERKLIWNIGYAKRSWFTAGSLTALLRTCGLEVLRAETVFHGDYLAILGRRARDSAPHTADPGESVKPLTDLLEGFHRHFESETARWEQRIAGLREHNETMVLWGAGMRGINFLSRFGDPTVFPRIVDVNPDRQGSYLPISGYFVDEPGILERFPPGRVLITNPSYEEEIRGQLKEMGVVCEVESL